MSKKNLKCVVLQCRTNLCVRCRDEVNGYHSVPPKNERQWFEACGRHDLAACHGVGVMNLDKLMRYRVCSLHFRPDQYSGNSRVRARLKTGAIPDINLTGSVDACSHSPRIVKSKGGF